MIRGVNADQFARDLKREFAEEILGRAAEVEEELALELLDDARAATPKGPIPSARRAELRTKDEGYGPLERGWAISVGAPDSDAFDGNEQALAGRSPGQPIYVQNNVFYASFLENGTSKMAPRPMVAPAVERLNKKVFR